MAVVLLVVAAHAFVQNLQVPRAQQTTPIMVATLVASDTPEPRRALVERSFDLPAANTNVGPIDINTLELPKGVEVLYPIELPTEPTEEATDKASLKLPTLRELAIFCLPTLGIWLSSPLLSLIDTSVVGLRAPTHHLAALAPSTKLCDYVAFFCTVIGTATTNLAAEALAEDQPGRAKRIVASSLSVALVLGAVVAGAMYFNAGALMSLMLGGSGTSAGAAPLLAAAREYTAIRALGYPAALLSMVLQAGFIASKDSTTPLLAVPVAAVVNLIGDLLLVAPLGAAGAAWATTGALYANALVLLAAWRSKMRTMGDEASCRLFVRPRERELRALLRFALPMMGALVARVFMGLSLTLSAVTLGTTALAANQVIESLYWLFCPFGEALSLCMQTYLPPLLLRGRALARRLECSALRAATGLGAVVAGSALALPLVLPWVFTSAPAVASAMAHSAPALAFALLAFVVSSAAEGMLVARKRLSGLAACHIANTAALSLALRAALRAPACGLQHVWLLLGACNVLRIAEFVTMLRCGEAAATHEPTLPRRSWRERLRRRRPRPDMEEPRRTGGIDGLIPSVADLAPHLVL